MSKVKELPCTPLISNHSASESGLGSPARTSRIFWRAASGVGRSGGSVTAPSSYGPGKRTSHASGVLFAALDIIAIVSVVAVAVLAAHVPFRARRVGCMQPGRFSTRRHRVDLPFACRGRDHQARRGG